MIDHPDPMDEVCREAHRRGQVVLVVPGVGPVFVSRRPGSGYRLNEELVAKVDQLAALLVETGATPPRRT